MFDFPDRFNNLELNKIIKSGSSLTSSHVFKIVEITFCHSKSNYFHDDHTFSLILSQKDRTLIN